MNNILLIFADQHRHDVMGCAGHPLVRTPHLDALAASGVRFEQAWCQSPICQPSRASVITGRYAHELGVIHNTGGFDPTWPTVMKQLQAAGYETATIGKTHYHESYQPPKEDGQIDMRDQADFVKAFGWDYVLEEYDKYLHGRDPAEDSLHRSPGRTRYARSVSHPDQRRVSIDPHPLAR